MAKKALLIDSTLAQYTAEDFSWLHSLLLEAGVFADNAGDMGLEVTQRGAGANMSVDVSIGNALITFTKDGLTWKIIGMSNAVENVPIAANSSGANRVDAIIMRADVDAEPNALKNNIITIERVAGTGVAALSDNDIQTAIGDDAFIRLANVTVTNGDTDITDAQIADTRTKVKTNSAADLSPKSVKFSILASDPSDPVEGEFWYNSTSHTLKYRNDTTTQELSTGLGDAVTQAAVDQSQTTRNGSVEVGEANATTKKNKLAQSFIPTKSKMRGVKLWKLVNLGTFTGTVKISLQADSGGSPSGSELASKTFQNAEWNAKTNWEFEAIFDTEYGALVPGALYWIVIECSTSDNSNHPALGTNTAGGYGSGSVKYWNTTDGWTAISTIDLYFKTLEGINSQITKTKSTGRLPNEVVPPRVYFQIFSLYISNALVDFQYWLSDQKGDRAVIYENSGNMYRTLPRNKGGSYASIGDTFDMDATYSKSGTNFYPGSLVDIGAYSYLHFVDFGTGRECGVIRFDRGKYTNNIKMTVSGGSLAAVNRNGRGYMYTDGTYLYFWISGTTWQKYSISGTTITYVADVTGPDMTSAAGFAQDNDYFYVLSVSSGTYTLSKYDFSTATLVESQVVWTQGSIYSSTSASATTVKGIFTADDGVVYLVFLVKFSTAASDGTGGAYYLLPVTTS